jgi:hypothetical protein
MAKVGNLDRVDEAVIFRELKKLEASWISMTGRGKG